MLGVRLWEARQQLGRKAAWWEHPSVPDGRSTGHGHAAQGMPRMEPGWLLGVPPRGAGKRVLTEGPVGLPSCVGGKGALETAAPSLADEE